jgi:preprotein translocase subunit Sec63
MNLFSRLIRIVESFLTKSESYYDYARTYREQYKNYTSDRTGKQSSVDPKMAEYYANLEIPYGSDLLTVKTAWKKLMRKYHPDLHARDPEKRQTAEILTQRLNKAYDELSQFIKNSNL